MEQNDKQLKPRKDIMLDIETLGKERGSIVLSVAFCDFPLHPDPNYAPLFCNVIHISIASSLMLHMTSDYETENWWSAPERKEAYNAMILGQTEAIPIDEAMAKIREIFDGLNATYDTYIWGRGVGSFDIPLLEEAIKRVWLKTHPDKTELEYKPTFPFYKAMDVRTLVNFCKAMGMTPEKRDTPHEAMADVEKQIAEVHECYKFLNSRK